MLSLGQILRQMRSNMPNIGPSWDRLLRLEGFQPRVVFDIGVAHGTFQLYSIFPDAFYHLIDPTPAAKPYMEKLRQHFGSCASVHHVALGMENGTLKLDARDDFGSSTGLAEADPNHKPNYIDVPLRRFDDMYAGPLIQPNVVKIDVQGMELHVLMGMGERLKEVDALIIETSTIATVEGGAEVAEIVEYLDEYGMKLHDVLGIRQRPLDGATAQLDLLFVQAHSEWRANRRWR